MPAWEVWEPRGPSKNLPRETYTHNLLSQSWVVTEAEEAEPVF